MLVTCDNWIGDRGRSVGECAKRVVERPTALFCAMQCGEHEGKPRGLGDRVARAVDLATLRRVKKTNRCGCLARQARLNRIGKGSGNGIN